MKCDDDTFIKVDSIMNEIKKVAKEGSVYIGNINYYHQPLRYGKWAVTYEVSFRVSQLCNNAFLNRMPMSFNRLVIFLQEWPEEDYPPYANGPGYIVSSDIAHFVVSNFERHKLRVSSSPYQFKPQIQLVA